MKEKIFSGFIDGHYVHGKFREKDENDFNKEEQRNKRREEQRNERREARKDGLKTAGKLALCGLIFALSLGVGNTGKK